MNCKNFFPFKSLEPPSYHPAWLWGDSVFSLQFLLNLPNQTELKLYGELKFLLLMAVVHSLNPSIWEVKAGDSV